MSSCKENSQDVNAAEILVLRDRLGRVQRQYEQLLQQLHQQVVLSSTQADESQVNKRLRQLQTENEQLAATVKRVDAARNEELANLVRANAELQNKLLRMQVVDRGGVVPNVPTPRGDRMPPPLFHPSIRAFVLSQFYQSMPPCSGSELETKILNSELHDAPAVLTLVAARMGEVPMDQMLSDFVSSILQLLPNAEESKEARLIIRKVTLEALSSQPIPGYRILRHCPMAGLLENPATLSLMCQHLNSPDSATVLAVLNLVSALLPACPENISFIQGAMSSSNIFLAISLLLLPAAGELNTSETFHMVQVRSLAVHTLAIAAMESAEPLALLSLRSDANDATIGEKAFLVVFQELLQESQMRHVGLPANYTKFLPLRISRIRDTMNVLLRLSALQGSIGDYAILVPSLFALVKALVGAPTPETLDFDSMLAEVQREDLPCVKELLTCTIPPPFDIEHSFW